MNNNFQELNSEESLEIMDEQVCMIVMNNDQVLLFTDFIQSVLEKRQKIIQTETVGSSVKLSLIHI